MDELLGLLHEKVPGGDWEVVGDYIEDTRLDIRVFLIAGEYIVLAPNALNAKVEYVTRDVHIAARHVQSAVHTRAAALVSALGLVMPFPKAERVSRSWPG